MQRAAAIVLMLGRADAYAHGEKCAAPDWLCAQFGEDEYLVKHFFSHKRNGTFFEMGANDGITASNTIHFARALGWHGVLIEGCPKIFEKLKRERPDSHTINMVATETERSVQFVGCSLTSGIGDSFSGNFAEKFHPAGGKDSEVQYATGKPLGPVLETLGYSHFDLFVLDVEGAEAQVLKSIDLSKVTFSVAMVEADGRNETKDEEVRSMFSRHGYLYRKVKRNDFFYDLNNFYDRIDYDLIKNIDLIKTVDDDEEGQLDPTSLAAPPVEV